MSLKAVAPSQVPPGESRFHGGRPPAAEVALGDDTALAQWLDARLETILQGEGRAYVVYLLRGQVPARHRDLAARLGGRLEVRALGRDGPIAPGESDPVDVKWATDGVALARRALRKGHWDLVVLVQAGEVAQLGLVDLDRLLELVDDRPPDRGLILCGQTASEELCEAVAEVWRLSEG